jgi:hypothetical protein
VAAKKIIAKGPVFFAAYPEGGGGFYGTLAAVREAAFHCETIRRYADRGGTPHGVTGRRASGLWPGVGRLWTVNARATEFGAKQRPGEEVITNEAVGRITQCVM